MARKRANGEGSIYKSKGVWIAEISVTINGKRQRKKKRAKSQADAKAFLLEMRTTLQEGMLYSSSTLTMSAFLNKWKEFASRDKSPSTVLTYNAVINTHLVPRLGKIKLCNLTSLHVEELLIAMKGDKEGPAATEKTFKVLKMSLDKAVAWNLISGNPVAGVKKPVVNSKKMFSFEPDECRLLLSESEGCRYHALIALGIGTGMRQGEMLALKWGKVNFDEGTLQIDEANAEAGGTIIVRKPKTDNSIRSIHLPEFCIEALHEHQKWLLANGQGSSELVFPSARGTRTYRSNFSAYYWKPLLKRCGLPHCGAHALRHTYATLALSNGVPVTIVSKVLGHANPAITLKVYAHALKDDQQQSVKAIGNLFA